MKKPATPTKPTAFGEYAKRVMKKLVGRPAIIGGLPQKALKPTSKGSK